MHGGKGSLSGGGPTIVILAAGRSSRYGAPKPLVPVGPCGETLPEFTIHDALAAGFGRVVFVVHPDMEDTIRGHLRGRLPGGVEVAFAVQQDPPGAPSRRKPWGTAAAVVAAAPHVDGPFAVANADDLYGAEALRLAAHHLEGGARDESGLVAYRLEETLSAAGGVSRAVCTVGSDGLLVDVEEVLDLRREGAVIRGRAARDGRTRQLVGHEPVSMNLWILRPAVVKHLRAALPRFVRDHEGDAQAEFLIGELVGDLVRSGAAPVRVLSCGARWFGITYPKDRRTLTAALARLSAVGAYPSPLAPGRQERFPG